MTSTDQVKETPSKPEQDQEEERAAIIAASHSYTDYLTFWTGLFSKDNLAYIDSTLEGNVLEEFYGGIYDGILEGSLQLVSTLNLNLKADEAEAEGNDDRKSVTAQIPVVPNDLIIFSNFVSFAKLFFPEQRRYQFVKWGYTCGTAWIQLSEKYPKISGIYELIGLDIQILGNEKVFDNIRKPNIGDIVEVCVEGRGALPLSLLICNLSFLFAVLFDKNKNFFFSLCF